MKKLKTILKYKYLILIFIVIISLIEINVFDYKSKYNGNEKYITGYIIEKKYNDNKTTLVLNGKEKILVTLLGNYKYNYHDYVLIKGKMSIPNNNTIFNIFNYKRYLKGKRINYTFNGTSSKLLKRNNNIFYSIKNSIENRINNYKSKDYLKVFILGDKTNIDKDMKNIYKNIGIIHLLSISGSYISIIIYILNKYIRNNKIISLILLFYLFLTNFQISIIRVCLCYILFLIVKKYKLDLDKESIIIILGSFLLLINPYYLYDIGFLLSFSISFSIIHFSYLLEEKNYIYKSLMLSLISFSISIPIIINSYYSINFLSVLFNIIYIPYTCFIIYPISILTFFIPFLDPFLLFFIDIFERLSFILNNITIFTFSFSKIPFPFYFLYYYLIFKKNNNFLFLILFFYIYNYYLFVPEIYFIDVGQGDSVLIRYKNKNTIIDTGGNYKYDNSNNLILFYKSIGVKKIDTMIISHGDLDHCKDGINLVKNFKVKNVIFNCGSFNELETKIIKLLDKRKIKYHSCIDKIDDLYFLQTNDYDNENDNSNVVYTKINNYKFMFMGDASITTEQEILNIYDLPNIDVLKVGHHGSKTSSSEDFIKNIKPKYSVISVGKNNRYGHPNKEVLENLKETKIYRTDLDGSIMFKIKNNKLKVETCKP